MIWKWNYFPPSLSGVTLPDLCREKNAGGRCWRASRTIAG